ncbi:Metallo-dependent phosphatase [Xylona heveae TC161]|uniref:Metallo-dependent phosphatase n=1 Tax=Xylona heveae (strain CBS 132557 / TC161) TaxID=1328760 RepID=A0A165FPI5_XYLHT|nr:Metallo-dependent phosphatase [Xylona heveae TC161]KZF21227.1 Metallo-dependent phosphatase [Xylona heveae TC161]
MPLIVSRRGSIFEPLSPLDYFFESPLKFIACRVYLFLLSLCRPPRPSGPKRKPLRVVCVSDTHCHTRPLPDGDLLIHSGDLTNIGSVEHIQAQVDWLKTLPHTEKVVIAGNHDSYFDPASRRTEDQDKSINWGDIHYLERSSVNLTFSTHEGRTLKIYGAPQIPQCGGTNFAFQHPRHVDTWSDSVPMDTDILVTHAPPKYHLDLPEGLGCKFLLNEVWRVKPTLHVFGHVHAGHGQEIVSWDEGQQLYERIAAKRSSGILADMVDIRGWLDAWKIFFYGIRSLWRSRINGDSTGMGLMVNAALVYRSTGKLGNPIEVVEL